MQISEIATSEGALGKRRLESEAIFQQKNRLDPEELTISEICTR